MNKLEKLVILLKGRLRKEELVPKLTSVKGPSGIYQAIRWVQPEETKKRVKQYIRERKRSGLKHSALVKLLWKVAQFTKRGGIEAYLPEDLERAEGVVRIAKTGEKYVGRHKLKDIQYWFEFKDPSKVGGLLRYVVYKPTEEGMLVGKGRPEWDKEIIAKRQEKKFKRVQKLAKNIGKLEDFRERYRNWLKDKSDKKKQLGCVLALMDLHKVRVGSGVGGIEEGRLKREELKRGMVVQLDGEEYPREVVEKADGLWLRSLESVDDVVRLRALEKEVKSKSKKLEKWTEKGKDTRELRTELEKARLEKDRLEEKIDKKLPDELKSVLRVGHYGATQLEKRHVKFREDGVWMDFIGKSGVRWNFKIEDGDLAEAVREIVAKRKGNDRTRLFPDVSRKDVANELKKVGGLPKDIRTYEATKAFMDEIAALGNWTPANKKELKQKEKELFEKVAKKLNHESPATTKSKYVDPRVYTMWKTGLLNTLAKGK